MASKPKVYTETTIPSFYYEVRKQPSMQARREWTRDWWDNERNGYDCFSSIAVVEELSEGSHPCKDQTLDFLKQLPLLAVNEKNS